jgi:hypothetical protein
MRYVGGLLVYAMIFFCVFTGLFAIVAQIGGVKFPGWGYIIGFTLGSTVGRACYDGYLLSLRHNRD